MRCQAPSKLLFILICGMPWSAQAGLESLFPPMNLGNPYGVTSNPLAGVLGLGNPYGNFNPLGGVGGALGLGALGAAPMILGPIGLGAGNLMYPGLQMVPNMMSHHHINSMSNPYMGGPFAGNPYLQPSMPLPFAPPAFSPNMPTLPFAGFGQAYPQPQPAVSLIPAYGAPGFMMPAQPAPTGIALPFALPGTMAPAAPVRSPTPALQLPFMPAPQSQPAGAVNPSPFFMPPSPAPARPQAASTPPPVLPFNPAALFGQLPAPAK